MWDEYPGVVGKGFSHLIGRIRSGPAFQISLGRSLTVSTTGMLSLRVNDPDISDNYGSISVQFEIK